MTQETKEVKLWTCLRCKHKWANRKNRKPKICPKCKSYLWDEPREGGNSNESQV
jgi:predicted Zn-ribbon and HTH transcriptional regulator